MNNRVTRLEEIEKLLSAGEFDRARAHAGELIRNNPQDSAAWLCIARIAVGMGGLNLARTALSRSESELKNDERWIYTSAVVDHYLGQSDRAVAALKQLIGSRTRHREDAAIFLADVLHRIGHRDEVRELICSGGAWTQELRGQILAARSRADIDPECAALELEKLFHHPGDIGHRRDAGFEAIQLYDRVGMYRKSWELAREVHQNTGKSFDMKGFLVNVKEQQSLVAGKPSCDVPGVRRVNNTGFIVGMPRSGTTLIEQMLDRHSQIQGIGEYEGISVLGGILRHHGIPFNKLSTLDSSFSQQLQNNYLEYATPSQDGKRWCIDKSLLSWQFLPAIAAILPGSRCIHIARDPRDTAVSLYLSNFNRSNYSWTRSTDQILKVMEAERSLSLEAMQHLGIHHETIIYEDLVEDVPGHAKRMAAFLDVELEPSMLHPEENKRTVLTLSHEQVRRPVNRMSIGRWRNYEWAFGREWEKIVALHESRRGG
jgi:hypothetical protein